MAQNPRSDRPGGGVPDEDALAADALPDEVRLHGEGDETDQHQSTARGTVPDPDEGAGGSEGTDRSPGAAGTVEPREE